MKRYRKLLISVLAIASLYVARETGLDQGLIDEVMDGIVESVIPPEELPEAQ